MKLRIRSSTGVKTMTVDPTWTLAYLKTTLNASALRAGYPPHIVDAPDELTLSTLFSNGDVIVVAAAANSPQVTPSKPVTTAKPVAKASLVVRVVPDDNSCLFRSVNSILRRPDSSSSVFALREEVASVVSRNPSVYSEAFLGRPNAEYCAWIMSENAWGGAIELSILAERHAVVLAAFDIKTMRCDRYGEGRQFPKIGFLVYDGIHYNYMAEAHSGKADVCLFDVNDSKAFNAAKEKAQKEHNEHKYTDTQAFSLICVDCGKLLKGEKEALEHAKATGHTNFTEYKQS